MKARAILPMFALFLSGISLYSQNIALGYGSTFANGEYSVFDDANGDPLDPTNNALLVAGYFDAGYDVTAGVSALKSDFTVANFSSFVSNFNELYSDDFGTDVGNASANIAPGFFFVDVSSLAVPVAAVGETPYIMALKCVTDFANAGLATEVGLFTDSSFATGVDPGQIPAGELIPTNYSLKKEVYSSVLLGSALEDVTLGAEYGGILQGQTGNIYATQAVPEPSTYAMMLGALSFGFVYYKRRIAGKKTDQKQEA